MVTIETQLTRDYGVPYPIVAAGMAFVGTTPDLGIAVCQAGGIGSLAVGPLPAPAVAQLVAAFRAGTQRPFHVNLITALASEDQVDACVQERAPIVSFHWGHPPRTWIDKLHRAGVKVWEQVGSAAAAREAVANGVDVLIAQGSEAGGHTLATLPLFVLLPEIVDAVAPTAVLAAGGIATGRQLAAALMLGAAGVWIGTRFVATTEAFAHEQYKSALVSANSHQTRVTSIYGPDHPTFNPMRVLDVGLTAEFAGREDDAPRDLSLQPLIGSMQLPVGEIPLRRFSSFVPTPATKGDIQQLPFLAGQGVGLIDAVKPVADVINDLMRDAQQGLSLLAENH